MKKVTQKFVSTYGAIMALAGIEHGIGEILQGNVAPSGIMILSWPKTEFFRNLGGEPAMTIIPNLLVAGILTVIVSLALLIWSVWFVQRKNGGWIMILLSIAMLLVGGGIFPPILSILIGAVATRLHTPASSAKADRSGGFQRALAKLWPWSYAAGVIAWPGIFLISYFFGERNPLLIVLIIFIALGALLLNIFTSSAADSIERTRAPS